MIWYKDFINKTPKQLVAFIYKCKWKREDVVDWLTEYEEDTLENLNDMSLVSICTKHIDFIKDFIWEEFEAAC